MADKESLGEQRHQAGLSFYFAPRPRSSLTFHRLSYRGRGFDFMGVHMKKIYWVFILTYVVMPSKNVPQCWEIQGKESPIEICDKEMVDDFAFMLNQAHERRLTSQAPVDTDPDDPIKWRDVPLETGK